MQARDSLRILFLAHNVVEAGTYVRFYGLARELAALGHRITLIAASADRALRTRELETQGIRLVLTPGWFHRRLRNGGVSPEDVVVRLVHVMSHDYDLIHASEHRPAGSLPAIVARARRGSSYVSDWADLWGREGIASERTWVMRRLLGRPESLAESRIHQAADAVTAVCSDLFSRAAKLGIPMSRLLRLPNGADTKLFKPSTNKEEARSNLGVPAGAKLLIYAGYAPIDMDLIWDAFRLACDRRKDVYLLVTGRVWPLPDMLRPHADHVIQAGFLPTEQYAEALACGDVMLLPYRNNSRNRGRWPGKLAFYMAVGRPTVSNPTGDVPALFEQRGVGLLAGETAQEFADAVLRLMGDRELADRMGRDARKTAESEYSWPVLAKALEQFYYSVLN